MLNVIHRVTTKGKKKKKTIQKKEIRKDQNSTLGEKNHKISQ